jgi:hypothetical protein
MPNEDAVAILAVRLEDASGTVLHRNFTVFVVRGDETPGVVTLTDGRRARIASVSAASIASSHWSLKQWSILGGEKIDGAGSGFFEYRIAWPVGLAASDVASATFLVEASAKRLNGKDRDTTASENDDYMRGGGFHDPSRNPNSYPMTGTRPFPSAVTVTVNGQLAGRWDLADDSRRFTRHAQLARAAARPASLRGGIVWPARPRADSRGRARRRGARRRGRR